MKIIFLLAALLISSVYCHEWTQISGGLTCITGSINHVWGVNAQDYIYRCSQLCNGNWVRIDGHLRQVDANDYEVWGVNLNNDIFKRPVDASGKWTHIGGKAYHVTASGNGYIWVIGMSRCAFKCKKPCSGSWSKVDTCSLKQLDAGEQYLYAVNNTNHILSRPVDGSGSWRVVPGRMKRVTVGPHEIFGIDTTNEVYRCRKPCLGEWEKVVFDDGDVKHIDATLNGVFAVSSGASIYQHKVPY